MASINHTALFLRLRDAAQSLRSTSPSDALGMRRNRKKERKMEKRRQKEKLLSPDQLTSEEEDVEMGQRREGGATSAIADAHTLPPRWVDLVERGKTLLTQVDKELDKLARLQRQSLRVAIGRDEKKKDMTIEVVSQDIAHILTDLEQLVEKLPSLGPAGSKPVVNAQRGLAAQLQSRSDRLRQLQREFLMRKRQQVISFSTEEGGSIIGGDSMGAGAGGTRKFDFATGMMAETISDEVNAAERERELKEVEKTIEELSRLFKSLSNIVIEQGTLVDRIDYNVESTVELTSAGLNELESADRLMRRSNKLTYCMFALVILVGIMSVLLVLKITRVF
eukprot:CAMPEP_0113886922 /NCGR_PEP_ID=MMETSP0780_2-20120614/11875_1 /TAXON_ID=652834 /ORGANISM="Palpitomonas bilix" /LENGTH=335 /DNA_ID=CAMNT_0000875293 /DNA_START=171 /DNA_END=1178 /DNA_ORIENTATION=+ /assembly_acc=CAM_ASM_000599